MQGMESESPERIASELVRRGLPIDYAKRVAAEFADHRHDLIAELTAAGMPRDSAEAEASHRLGARRTLVKKTVREYQRRHWCARWPLITFLIAPIPLVVLGWAVSILLASGCVLLPLYLIGVDVDPPRDGIISSGEYAVNLAYQAWNFFFVPAAVTYILARFARRAALPAGWLALSSSILAVFLGLWQCGFPTASIRPIDRPTPADEFLVTVSLSIFESWQAAWQWYTRSPAQVGQFLLPLVVFAALAIRHRQLASRREQLALTDC